MNTTTSHQYVYPDSRRALFGVCLFSATMVFLLLPKMVNAQAQWTATGSIEDTFAFADPDNWLDGVVPSGTTAAGDGTFANNATGTILLESDHTVRILDFQQTGNLIFDLSENTLTGSSTFNFSSGGGNNTITIKNGAFSGFAQFRLDSDGNSVTLTDGVTGTGTNYIRFGGSDNNLTINNGATLNWGVAGQVSNVGGSATSHNNLLRIDGDGSSFGLVGSDFYVGAAGGEGNRIEVLNGGSLEATLSGDLRVGTGSATTDSSILISGEGSTFVVNGLASFRGNGGQILVEDGGSLTVTGLLTVTSGTGANNNSLVLDSGVASLGELRLGSNATATASSVELGNGSTLNVSGRTVMGVTSGSAGNHLSIKEGSTASVAGNFEFSHQGTVTVDGGTLSVLGANGISTTQASPGGSLLLDFKQGVIESTNATVNSHLTFNFGDESAEGEAIYRLLNDGTHTYANVFAMHSNARIEGTGTLNTSVSSLGAGAVIAPGVGAGFGILNIAEVDNNDMLIALKIGDFSSTEPVAGIDFDQVNVSGTFHAGGTIFLDLDNFVTGIVSSILLVGWNDFDGNFGDVDVVLSNPGAPVDWSFQADGFYVTVIPEAKHIAFVMGMLMVGMVLFRLKRRSSK